MCALHIIHEAIDKLDRVKTPVCKCDKGNVSVRTGMSCSVHVQQYSGEFEGVAHSLFCGFRSRADRGHLQAIVLVHNVLSSIFIFWYTNHGSRRLSSNALQSMKRLSGMHFIKVSEKPRSLDILCHVGRVNQYIIKNMKNPIDSQISSVSLSSEWIPEFRIFAMIPES